MGPHSGDPMPGRRPAPADRARGDASAPAHLGRAEGPQGRAKALLRGPLHAPRPRRGGPKGHVDVNGDGALGGSLEEVV